jgi:hypothetical protein
MYRHRAQSLRFPLAYPDRPLPVPRRAKVKLSHAVQGTLENLSVTDQASLIEVTEQMSRFLPGFYGTHQYHTLLCTLHPETECNNVRENEPNDLTCHSLESIFWADGRV